MLLNCDWTATLHPRSVHWQPAGVFERRKRGSEARRGLQARYQELHCLLELLYLSQQFAAIDDPRQTRGIHPGAAARLRRFLGAM